MNVIDIGASYFSHGKWKLFMRSKKTNWYAVDPNENNLGYVDNWIWDCKIKKIAIAISNKSEKTSFYITNEDSGSSILKPHFNENIEHRSSKDYFFPYKKIQLDTVAINEVIEKKLITPELPTIMKLDTQGTEFNIIQSLEQKYLKNIICFELESNLHAEPAYENSSHISEVFKFFNENGYELMDIDIMRSQKKTTKNKINSKNIPNECDLIFIKKSSLLRYDSTESILAALGVYFCYGLYEELVFLSEFILNKNLKLKKETSILLKNIIYLLK
ncbi:FkbM family methyltransferase [Flavobacteriaceae bacterium]|nr:FkbM family methyltransferase [Flavobacteriaceae bacterium]